jgi:hypothetical protein
LLEMLALLRPLPKPRAFHLLLLRQLPGLLRAWPPLCRQLLQALPQRRRWLLELLLRLAQLPVPS